MNRPYKRSDLIMSQHKNNKITGGMGENLAAEFLADKGYRVLERNWHTRWGELDIIAQKSDVLVFVEVKTKIGDAFGSPEEMVNSYKLAQVRRMTEVYRVTKGFPNQEARIDVVAVVLDREHQPVRVTHYENVI